MNFIRNQKGQGMTEYIIIVAVIAIACVAAFSYFGKTVRNQTAAMSESLAGDTSSADEAIAAAKSSADQAVAEGQADANLKDYDKRQAGTQ
jgi:Flp pilus assembly pilin Flp